jgi:GNAT superfamily N-acetyltransferase
MQRRDRSTTAAALARAFHYDPLFEFFLPDRARQHRGSLRFMESSIADAEPFKEIWIAKADDGKVASAAIWLPPDGYPRSKKRDYMTMVRTAPVFVRSGKGARDGMRLLTELERVHHRVVRPHAYLAVLGTDPLFSRQGAASAALAPMLAECDRQGLPAYLETQKEENLAFYNRHGFEFQQMVEVVRVPKLWTMLRQPRG